MLKKIYICAALLVAFGVPIGVSGQTDAEQAALQAELDALLNEIQESSESGTDPFADGSVPNLVVLSSSDVQGEVAPCG